MQPTLIRRRPLRAACLAVVTTAALALGALAGPTAATAAEPLATTGQMPFFDPEKKRRTAKG